MGKTGAASVTRDTENEVKIGGKELRGGQAKLIENNTRTTLKGPLSKLGARLS